MYSGEEFLFSFFSSLLFYLFVSLFFLRETLSHKREKAIDHEVEQDPLWAIHICVERYCDTPV